MPANTPSITSSRLSWNFPWLEWTIILASATIFFTCVLTYVQVPTSLASLDIPILHAILSDTDKVWLVLVWASAAASVLIVYGLARFRVAQRLPRVLRIGFTVLVVLSTLLVLALAVDRSPSIFFGSSTPDDFWIGFGVVRFLIGVLAALAAIALAMTRFANRRVLLVAALVLAVLLGILPLLQAPWLGTNNVYTFDELLAPAAGRLPGFDFISQYETLLGFPVALVAGIAPAWFAQNPEWVAMVWITIMQATTLVVAVAAVMKVAPRRLRWIGPLAIVPMVYVMGPDGLSYYATFPFRFVLPTVLLAVIVYLQFGRRQTRWWTMLAIGLVAGLTATNNLDFGIPAVVAGMIAVTLSARTVRAAIRTGLLYLAGTVAIPLVYIAIGALAGRTFHRSYLLFFVESFGVAGYNNEPISTLDLHNAFVFIGILGLVVGAVGVRAASLRRRILFTAMIFESSWLLLGLPYYSGRSLIQTLITAYSLQVGVVLMLLFVAAFPRLRLLRRAGFRTMTFSDWTLAFLSTAALGFLLASWTVYPSLPDEAKRIQAGDVTEYPFTSPSPEDALKLLPSDVELSGVLSVTSGIWAIRTGVRDADVFLHPDYLTFPQGPATECTYLDSLPGNALLTTKIFEAFMAKDANCRRVLDFGSATSLLSQHAKSPDPGDWVLIPRK